ncbi:hypothetical protein LTS08_008911 [Lithohypha guttulata]|uniref:DUF7924 domain-containing protein n=1 Tax=Lithohypha guttulata TaxID=1690604 RepID=A0AAN7PS01_9EURO|nr:hypothetical protein LTR05_008775 [Lithohypha guttulata]KAK5093465.1 hypothetical protein LTS08_008911 [Lithohypha guttulata]
METETEECTGKRRKSDHDSDPSPHKKRRWVSGRATSSSSVSANNTPALQSEHITQLPSPSSTQVLPSPQQSGSSPTANSPVSKCKRKRKHEADFLPSSHPPKQPRLSPSVVGQIDSATPELDKYFQELPASQEEFEPLTHWEHEVDPYDMNPPTSKRPRPSDVLARRLSSSGRSTDTALSKEKKYSVYKDVNYPVVLETKGSFMRASDHGLSEEDEAFCATLHTHIQTLPPDLLFDDDHFVKFHANLRNRSEARITTDLHSRVMPSVENMCIAGRAEFAGLIEGHNDLWVKAIPFFGPRPQPDHTIGFRWWNFTEIQRRKLNIEPTAKSLYTAREEMFFPFFTGEVKCGRQGLDLADRPNAHSMTIHMRGIVDLYRRASRLPDLHRRALGFSMSHDDQTARLYVHYVEIDHEEPTYYMQALPKVNFGDNQGEKRWQCYQFTVNVCELFALPFLDRLKEVIDTLPDPVPTSSDLVSNVDDISVQSSQDEASGVDSQEEGTRKGHQGRVSNAELRNVIQGLQREIESQRQDVKEREARLTLQLEQQRTEAKEREAALLTQLEEQRKNSEEQRKIHDEHQKQLMSMLAEQSKQLKTQSDEIKKLLQKR